MLARFAFALGLLLAPLAVAAPLTLESIFLDGAHDGPDRPDLQWIEDGRALVRTTTSDDGALVLARIDARNGREEEWLRIAPWEDPIHGEVEASAAVVAPGEKYVLVKTRAEKRWRRSTYHDHWIYDVERGDLWMLSEDGQELHAKFSPDGSKVGFVLGGRLHWTDLAERTRTTLWPTAMADDRSFGDPDWVYEEEFDMSAAWWWSPTSDRVAALHFDNGAVGRFPMVVTGDEAMPEHRPFDYPKAGTTNSDVALYVVDGRAGDAPLVPRASVQGSADRGLDAYLVRAAFTPGGDTLVYQVLSRDQKTLRVYAQPADDAAAPRRLVLEETAEAWVEVDNDLHLLDDGTFLWTSRRTGFRHVWRGSLDGGPLTQVTRGDFDVRSIEGADAERAFVRTARSRPVDAKLEVVDLESGEMTTIGPEQGWSGADVAPDASAVVHRWSTATHRTRIELLDAKGKRIALLHDDDMGDLADAAPIEIELRTIDVEGAPPMWGRITRRADLDPQVQHPVLIYVYGGPAAQAARDSWGGTRGLFHRWLVERGWVVVTADGRGSAGRGVEYETATYLQLGTHEIDDQVRLVEWLQTQSWVDPDAIAIHGSSYGGYASIGTMIRGGGKLAAGIAAAPVTDWTFYDTGYTERFMLRPQDNPDGYAGGSWLDEVDGLQGRLLLIHGTGDDNVHDQNSHRLTSALVDAKVPFDLMIYPDKAHALSGKTTRFDLYRRHAEHLDRWVAPVVEIQADPEPAGR